MDDTTRIKLDRLDDLMTETLAILFRLEDHIMQPGGSAYEDLSTGNRAHYRKRAWRLQHELAVAALEKRDPK